MEFESDETLAKMVERGGPIAELAVTLLYRRHPSKVYSLCRRYFEIREDAEEASSEAFLRALRALRALNPGQFRGDSRYLSKRIWKPARTAALKPPRLAERSRPSIMLPNPPRLPSGPP